MKTFVFPVFLMGLLCPGLLMGQGRISGRITDINTRQPIEYATVYISGTSNGTISDTAGYFHLDRIKAPCQLVVSHISYNLATYLIDNQEEKLFNIQLTPKEIVINPINVMELNLRESIMKQFHDLFLGSDVWGKNAEILNPEVLRFKREYIQDEISVRDKRIIQKMEPLFLNLRWTSDSTASYQKPVKLEVDATGPIQIELPLLGYKLTVNLVNFNWEANVGTSFLGYYYFQALSYESKRDSIRINGNRKKAYVHSSMHFGHSLFKNQLAENGYEILEKEFDNSMEKPKWEVVALDSFLCFKENHVEIIGLKEKNLRIVYYQKEKHKPMNLNTKNQNHEKLFYYKLKLLKDTCIIRSDGSIPDNSIQFGPAIGGKRVGAFLPDDFISDHY